MSSNLLRRPLFYFILQVAGLAAAFLFLGKFNPVPVGDTSDYLQFPLQEPVEALRHPRTCGYPLFLAISCFFAPQYQAAPVLDFALHVVAVGIFWLGLRRIIQSPWTSTAVASSLLYSNTLLRYGSNLAADSLASSLAIATIGWLLVTVFSPSRRYLHWWTLALGVFACYQARPAYLFMILLVPVLGAMLWWLAMPNMPAWRQWRPLLASLVLAVSVPYLAFCTVRWLAVDQFSLVSFGGNNFAAVVCMFVSDDDVENLPADAQPLAEAIVRRRHEVAENRPDYTAEATRRYMQIEVPFDTNINSVCVAAAREVYGDDWVEGNRALWQFAAAVVAEKPVDYSVWLVKAFIRAVYMIVSEYVMSPVYFFGLFALTICHTWSVVLRKRSARDASQADPSMFVEINALWMIAGGFALAQVALVIATTPPLGRFMDAAGVFFACVLARVLANRIALCRHLTGTADV